MPKISIEDLARIKEKTIRTNTLREGAGRVKVTVHMGTCGIAAGARDIMSAVLKEIDSRNLNDIIVTNSGCAGLCSKEPMITVEVKNEPAPVKYILLNPEKIKKVFDSHIVKGQILKEFALAVGSETTA
jgi:NADP-reducing hydrogenase subunit HndB